ncbi:MAG: very short patch repair endonuclease [Planctomycetia bacterium]|nr:very short patch repair endonuclease [Planctomycetia bacterium]
MATKKAGHRSWKLVNGKVSGRHNGDIMSVETRSRLMSRIKGTSTTPERVLGRELRKRKIYFATHAAELPGKPDIVFRRIKLAVFIDGDFWHGWRFPLWKHKLTTNWQRKIEQTRKRDQRNFGRLRRAGWKVIRIWEHQVEQSPSNCIEQILRTREVLL